MSTQLKLKDVIGNTISSTLNTANDVVPLVGVTITTGLVVANSWLAEFVNEDADFDNINKLKDKMLANPSQPKDEE